MELVYLWVEGYKNIKRQGFNFSPRFEYTFHDKYKEDGTLEENCKLDIIDKEETGEDYLKDFFGDNINVTAIVGKNGSGKSNVLELLIKIANKYNLLNTKCFFVYKKLEQLYVVGNIQLTYNYLDSSFFNNNDDESISWINYSYSRNDIHLKKYVERQSIFNMYGGNNIWKHTQVYNKFSNILFALEKKYKFNTFLLKIKPVNKNILEEKDLENNTLLDDETIILCKEVISSFYSKKQRLSINSIKNITMESLLAHNTFLLFVTFYIMNKDYIDLTKEIFVHIIKDIKSNNSIDFIFENFHKILGEDNDFKIYFQQLKFLKENIDKFIFDGKEFYIWDVELSDMNIIENIIENTKVISGIVDRETYYYLIESVYYDFSNNQTNIFYNDLSDGEKEILKISIDFLHHLDFNSNYSTFIFDEIDNSLHPIWKKEILKILINIFNEFKKIRNEKRIHLIFTTHSPFLLSDLPKENVIFLDTYKKGEDSNQKEGNCKNVTDTTDINPFGANIHTLLSDGFFMEDGLMGEFAKGKINEIIEFFSGKNELYKDNERKLKQIIESIGEPFLKDKLLKMYDKKYPKSNEEKIIELQKQIDELNNG